MPRHKKNASVRKAMCRRFVKAMDLLELNASEISRELGYANSTTISKVLRGEAFVDVERLSTLAQLRTPGGKHIDLNWLIAGRGEGDNT